MALEFTAQQKKVIAHDHTKHGVVRAGPGTGKSATVVALAERLQRDYSNIRLKFLTFTRAATSELTKKVSSTESLGIKPSTIHSFATSILMQNQDALPIPLPLRIPSEYEIEKIIYPYIQRLMGIQGRKGFKRVKDLVKAQASMWESLDPDFTVPDITSEEKSKFISAFQQATTVFGFTLLDQLPDLLRRLINDHADVKGLEIDFMIIDEYQDLNKCETELLKLLNSKGIKILAVGDEDQSIYSFRKAHPAGIRDFENHFSDAVSYDLSICHRCPSNLLNWAQHVIQGDLERSARPLPQSNSRSSAEMKLLHFPGDVSESKGITDLIVKLTQNGFEAHEILVLTRSDDKERFTKKIKENLSRKNIKTFDQRDLKKLLDTQQIRKLLVFLRLLDNESDSLGWCSLLKETPGIGTTSVDRILSNAQATHRRFGSCVFENSAISSKPSFQAINQQLDNVKSQYEEVKNSENHKWGEWVASTIAPLLKTELPQEFTELLKNADARIELESPTLGYFISQIVPISKDLANEQKIGVRFMTMQGSKGLTARATIIVGVDSDLIPSRWNLNHNEERRLLYVAMTRSQEFLVMSWANRRRGPQARSSNANLVRRNHTLFLQGGQVQSEDGTNFINYLFQRQDENVSLVKYAV